MHVVRANRVLSTVRRTFTSTTVVPITVAHGDGIGKSSVQRAHNARGKGEEEGKRKKERRG
jgi:hypothetical protein